ncbi:MazG family protein [Coprothermobacteraceae bacterium]|nr:MazG family protein [Coprothermobacteraceae bacterium]
MNSYEILRGLFVCVGVDNVECNSVLPFDHDLTSLCLSAWKALLTKAPVCVACANLEEAAAFTQAFFISMGYTHERAEEEVQSLFGLSVDVRHSCELPSQLGFEFVRFKKIVEVLREKCPWDREVTPYQLVTLSREELSELLSAINEGDTENYAEELGDLFLHLMLHAVIAEQNESFSLEKVLSKASDKAVSRHPHVFASERDESAAVVLDKWQKRKKKPEKRPPDLIVWALRLQDEAKQYGLDWKQAADILPKLYEEADELARAMATRNVQYLKEEIGDLFFTLINLARHLHVDPEDALSGATKKFEQRLRYVKQHLGEKDVDALWEDSKNEVG